MQYTNCHLDTNVKQESKGLICKKAFFSFYSD